MSLHDQSNVRITVLVNDVDSPLGAWTQWPGADCEVIALASGALVPPLDELGDGLVVLGGGMSAYDDDHAPWLASVRALMAGAVDRGIPTMGICLGAQLLAVALGGRVEVGAPPGLEAGLTTIFWRAAAQQDPVLAEVAAQAIRSRSVVISMHEDAVVELPEGAQWLASSNQYPFQAFRLGSGLGLQFHPEATPAMLEHWYTHIPGLDAGDLAAMSLDWGALQGIATTMAAAFVDQCRATSR